MLRPASFFVFGILLAFSTFASQKSFEFVVTGGLMGVADGSRFFFNSPLFRLKSTSEAGERFVITDAKAQAYRFGNTVLLPYGRLSSDQIAKAVPSKNEKGVVQGLKGAQLFAVRAAQGTLIPEGVQAEELGRELGAVASSVAWEMRQVEGVAVLALCASGAVRWPKEGDALESVLAVRGRFGDEKASQYLFFPREAASTERVFGTVDALLKTHAGSQYLDLGDALFGEGAENVDMAEQMQNLMLVRKPVVLGAAWNDFRAFWQKPSLMQNAPYVASLSGKALVPSSRVVETIGQKKVLFASLPASNALLDIVLPEGTSVSSIDEALSSAGLESRQHPEAFVIGLSQDAEAALKAVASPVLDAVFALVPAKGGVLPSYDEIDLTQNRKDGLRSVAPLVRVSALDVTLVSGFVDAKGQLEKLVIKRHAILDDGERAADATRLQQRFELSSDANEVKIPSRAQIALKGVVYDESEFNAILGGLLRAVRPKTELAIVERFDALTPIESAIPMRLAQTLLNERGRAIWLQMKGKYVKRVFKAIKAGQFGLDVSVIGASLKGPVLAGREIADAESYDIVVSERVFNAIDRFMAHESLFALRNLPSSGVQTALLEGGKDTLKILAEIRKRDSRDDPSIGDSRALFAASFPIADLIEPKLSAGLSASEVTRLIADREGRVARTLILEISDLDLGFKFNAVNDTLSSWQKEAQTPGTNPGFLEPRFWDPSFSQKLIYVKASLKYIGTLIDSEIGTNIKFFQPNTEPPVEEIKDILKYRPAKDSVKVEGEVRIPFRRLFDEPPTGFWDLGPFVRTTYETQIWPNKWLTRWPEEKWPHRVNDLRVLMGLSAKPLASEEVLRAGAVFDYDFSRTQPSQSFGYGFELGGQGKWNVGLLSLKLDSSIRQLFPVTTPDATRMGLVWLIDGKVEVPIYGGFSVSMLANTTLGTRMNDPLAYGYSVLFGFALSYSDRLKWLL